MSTIRRKPSATLTRIMSSISDEDKRRMRDRMLVAVKIADALEAKKLSQKAFAEIMGKSESEISEWLSGNRNFTIDTLSDISDCLGIRLLPNSDIRTRRVSAHAVHVKVKKTRPPRQYSMSGNNVFRCGCGEWSISDNFVLA